MAKFEPKDGKILKRFEVSVWEGLNTIVSDTLSKRGELKYLENARSTRIGWLEKRAGHALFGASLSATQNYGLFDFINDKHTLIRVSQVSAVVGIYRYSVNSNGWIGLTSFGTGLSAYECDFTVALNRCFIVNGMDNNRYIESGGSQVVDSSVTSGLLYNSPIGRLVNYYKDRLYLGDYLPANGIQQRTGICFSSPPLGIVSLVNGDQGAGITTINVTDTKYIKVSTANDSLDVYRGGSLITTLTVTGKTENTLTVSTTAVVLKSNDELWVANTRSGERVFRWDNRGTGINVREYDTFKNISEENLTLLANVGNNQLIFTANSISSYNGNYLRPLDLEVGCVAKNSFVKMFGQGIFLHYTGIYSTTGGVPRLLSAKIQQIFDNADRATMDKSCAASDGFSYFVHIGTVTFYEDDGSVKKIMANTVVEYNLRQNNFYIHTDVPMSHMVSFVKNQTRMVVFAKTATMSINVSESMYVAESISGLTIPSWNVADSVGVAENVTVTIT